MRAPKTLLITRLQEHNFTRQEQASTVKVAGVEKGHAHRMRVTMAVELLKRGVSVENVAAILGNPPLIVQKHYAPFVPARQWILEKQVMATW